MVIGAPGSGKTTLLQHMALSLISGRKARLKVGAPAKLPIVLYLRDHANAINENTNLTLTQALRTHLEAWEMDVPPSWFRMNLKRGRCIVMLDGLDEVADTELRRKVVNWVQRQMEAYPRNRFIVTSRPYGYYKQHLDGVAVLEVSPFSQGQVRQFVHNWYLANEVMSKNLIDDGVRLDAKKGAEDLIKRLANSDLAALAVNPLLLTMIATVHRYKSSLPKRRVELYKEICEVFLGQRRQSRNLEQDLTPAQNQRVLQPLAYHLMNRELREIDKNTAIEVITDSLKRVNPDKTGTEFIKGIEQESGLLLEKESGVLSFAHKTFQEYLTSVHILENDLQETLTSQVENDWWHETIRLYTAQTDASAVVGACLIDDPSSIQALTLAIECSEEALELKAEIRTQLDEVLTKGVEDPDDERRRVIAETLLALRLKKMTRVDEDRYIDNSLIAHAEYQLFLDEMRAENKYFQPDHWIDYRFPEGEGKIPVVGVRPSDAEAFCYWLTQRDTGNWRYRLLAEPELHLPKQDANDIGLIGFWYSSGTGHHCEMMIGQKPRLSFDMLQPLIALDLARANGPDLALALDLDRALNLTRANGPDLARNLALALDLALALALTLDLALARDLDLAPARDLDLVHPLVHPLARDKVEFLQWFIRLNSYLIAATIYLAQYRIRVSKSIVQRITFNRQQRTLNELLKSIAGTYFSIYVDFAILVARRRGELPAFEGIRIVKERVNEDGKI